MIHQSQLRLGSWRPSVRTAVAPCSWRVSSQHECVSNSSLPPHSARRSQAPPSSPAREPQELQRIWAKVCMTSCPHTFPLICIIQNISLRMIGAMIMRAVYGLDVYGPDEKYVSIAEKSMECFSAIFDPGRYLVHTLPWLRFVPVWFPGAGFQRDFAAWKPQVTAARDEPWEAAVEKRVSRIRLAVPEL